MYLINDWESRNGNQFRQWWSLLLTTPQRNQQGNAIFSVLTKIPVFPCISSRTTTLCWWSESMSLYMRGNFSKAVNFCTECRNRCVPNLIKRKAWEHQCGWASVAAYLSLAKNAPIKRLKEVVRPLFSPSGGTCGPQIWALDVWKLMMFPT